MTEITGHELALKKLLGPRVVGIDVQVFLQRACRVQPSSMAGAWQALKAEVGGETASDEAGIESLQVHTALAETIKELGLSAVGAGCYPDLMGKVCLVASLLGEQVSCEGDLNGALGMLILTRLTGCPVHNTDLLDPDPGRERHHLFALWVGWLCLFPARPGPVTLLNIVPKLDAYILAGLHGEAVETDMVFPGNPLRVRFKSDYLQIFSWIIEQGLGHHWMAAYGDLRQSLGDLAAMDGCAWLENS
jgi:L-fucose isomerase-like protein